MSREDWYRSTRWDAETEAAFNRKLARSRSQRAQYLRIQGSLLKDRHPAAAIELLRRCIAEGDAFHIAHACLDMAYAHYVQGDVDGALASLAAAIEQEEREPRYRTSACYDYAFLAALHARTEHYDRALALLAREGDGLFAAMIFEAEAAKALIHAARDQHRPARRAAERALAAQAVRAEWIPGHADVGVVPNIGTPLQDRLRDIIA